MLSEECLCAINQYAWSILFRSGNENPIYSYEIFIFAFTFFPRSIGLWVYESISQTDCVLMMLHAFSHSAFHQHEQPHEGRFLHRPLFMCRCRSKRIFIYARLNVIKFQINSLFILPSPFIHSFCLK